MFHFSFSFYFLLLQSLRKKIILCTNGRFLLQIFYDFLSLTIVLSCTLESYPIAVYARSSLGVLIFIIFCTVKNYGEFGTLLEPIKNAYLQTFYNFWL